jgi:hypothetical protein
MLFYNWNKIFEMSRGNVVEIFKIFEMITKSEIPQSKYDTMFKYSKHKYVGSSFLVHPDVLLYNSYKHPYKEIATYLAAASIRNIAEYIANQTTTLELLHVPFADTLVANINTNSLLRIDDMNKIHFLYEEAPKEKH